MLPVCIDFVSNFSFTVTTDVPTCLWDRMVRGTEETCTKAINICILLPKQQTKKLHNNQNHVSWWWNVFREWWAWLHCLVVLLYIQCRQKSLITHKQILCRNRNLHVPHSTWLHRKIFLQGQYTMTILWYDGEYPQLVHPSTSCLRVWIPWTETAKIPGHEEDTEIICRKVKWAVWHPTLTQIQWLLGSEIPHSSLKIKTCNNEGIVPLKNIPSCRYSMI